MKVSDMLKGVNTYPVTSTAVQAIALRRGLDLDAECTAEICQSRAGRLAVADVLMWISKAPDGVSDSGQSVNLSESTRKRLAAEARAEYAALGEADGGVVYGYKGSRL